MQHIVGYKWVKGGSNRDCSGCYYDGLLGNCPTKSSDPTDLECIEIDEETGEEIFYKYMED